MTINDDIFTIQRVRNASKAQLPHCIKKMPDMLLRAQLSGKFFTLKLFGL